METKKPCYSFYPKKAKMNPVRDPIIENEKSLILLLLQENDVLDLNFGRRIYRQLTLVVARPINTIRDFTSDKTKETSCT